MLWLSPSPGVMLQAGQKLGETKMTTHLCIFSLHRGFVTDSNKGKKQLHTLKASANVCVKQQYPKLWAKGNLQVLPAFGWI